MPGYVYADFWEIDSIQLGLVVALTEENMLNPTCSRGKVSYRKSVIFSVKKVIVINTLIIRVPLLSLLILTCLVCHADAFQKNRQRGNNRGNNNNRAQAVWRARVQQAAQQQRQVVVQSRAEATRFLKTAESRVAALKKEVASLQGQVSNLPSVESLEAEIKAARAEHDIALDQIKAAKESGEVSDGILDEELSTKNKLKAKKVSLQKTEGVIRDLYRARNEMADIKENIPFAKQYIAQTNKVIAQADRTIKKNKNNNRNNNNRNNNRKRNNNRRW